MTMDFMPTLFKRTRRDPLFPVGTLNDLFSPFLTPFEESQKNGRFWNPSTDAVETEDAYLFSLELPGLGPDDVTIEVSGNTLNIRGEKQSEERQDNDQVHFLERRYGSFQRTFELPSPMDEKDVQAEVAKAKQDQKRRIQIKGR